MSDKKKCVTHDCNKRESLTVRTLIPEMQPVVANLCMVHGMAYAEGTGYILENHYEKWKVTAETENGVIYAKHS